MALDGGGAVGEVVAGGNETDFDIEVMTGGGFVGR
jgi:hypothetical protein